MRFIIIPLILICYSASAQKLSLDYLPELATRMGDSSELVSYIESKGFEQLYFSNDLVFLNKNVDNNKIWESIKIGQLDKKISFIRYVTNQKQTLSQWLTQLENNGFKLKHTGNIKDNSYNAYQSKDMAVLLCYFKKEDGMDYVLYMQPHTDIEDLAAKHFAAIIY